jgi:beta-glucosidase
MLTGKYAESYLAAAGKNAPRFTAEELEIISSPLDFVGVNIYVAKSYAQAIDKPSGYRELALSSSHPTMFSSWHTFSPEVLYWGPRIVDALWRPREIYITENGCAAADTLAPDGQIYDEDRVMYLRNAMAQLQRAAAEGIPVKGNFVWSLMDNFEWGDGYGTRFGMVYVDYKTQKRTPKLSARWHREAARQNAVV